MKHFKPLFLTALVSAAAFAGGDAAKGAEKFNTLCTSCHGEKGDGNGPAGAALTPRPTSFVDPANAARLTDDYMFKVVKEGGAAVGKSPMMVSWAGALKDDEIKNVVAYVQKLKGAKK